MINIIIAIILIMAAFFGIVMVIDNNRFVVREYAVRAPKILRPVRIVFIADLHEKSYGSDNDKLIGRIRELDPDMILIGGDLVVSANIYGHYKKIQEAGKKLDEKDFSWMPVSASFVRRIAGICPVWFVKGNHELRLGYYEELSEYDKMFRRVLEEAGVRLIGNGSKDIFLSDLRPDKMTDTDEDTGLRLCGLELPMEYYAKFKKTPLSVEKIREMVPEPDKSRFNVMLTHSPVYFEQYVKWGADLALCGHVHGGLMRLPLIGGVVGTRPTLFPKYSGGRYHYRTGPDENGREGIMVLTCGLGMHTLPIRIFNPGEISVIDLGPSEKEK